jgi:hypothetical protein
MTVMRTPQGGLVIHNAMRVPEPHLKELAELGKVVAIVIPNIFHDSDAPWFAAQYPGVPVFAPHRVLQKTRRRCPGTEVHSLEESFAAQVFSDSVRSIQVPGQRWLDETWFYHVPSESLVLCDLAFNMSEDQFNGVERVLMRWNRVGRGFGPSRLATSVFIRDHAAFGAAMRGVASLEFSRIIVSHGSIIESGAAESFRIGFAEFLSEP